MFLYRFAFIFLVLSFASVPRLCAQNVDTKITGNYKGQNLNQVLKKLQSKYDLQFAFDETRLAEIYITENFKQENLSSILIRYLWPKNLSYLVLDNTIIIKPIEEIPPDQLPVYPGKYSISGFIYDSLSRERLPYALAILQPSGIANASNTNGFFSFRDLTLDSGVLEIQYLGYQKVRIPFSKTDINQSFKIALWPNNSILQEVLVKSNTNEFVEVSNEISKININPAQMSNLPNLGEVDIFRSIQLLPGINGTFETASNINIRGSAPDQNLILFDGFNVYHLDHFFGIFSAFNNNSIKNINIYKGGFEAKYGGRVGGVLDITGKTGNSEKPVFGVGINFIGLNSLVELPIGKKTNVFVAARRSLTDFLPSESYRNLIENVLNYDLNTSPTNTPKTYEELNPTFNFYDINAKVSHRFSEQEKISLSMYHGRDLLRIDNSDDFKNLTFNTENNTRWGNIGLGLIYNRQWEKNFYTDFSLGISNYFSRVTYGASKDFLNENDTLNEFVFFEQKNDVDDISLKIDNGWNYSSNNQLEFGLWITNNRISYSVFNDSVFTEELSETGNQSAAYVQNKMKIGRKLEITPGFRINYYDVTNDLFLEPRLSGNFKINDKISLKGAYGKYYQVVSRVLRRNVFASNPDFWVLSDDVSIPVLSSDHLIGGVNINLSKFWTFDTEIYHKWDGGVLEYIPPEGIFANSAPGYSPYYRGKGISKGIEFLLQRKGKNYNGWVSYAYSISENQFEELNNNQQYPSDQDQRHEIKFINMYTIKRIEFSAVWIYGTGRPYTAPLGNFIAEDEGADPIEVLYVSDINSFRLPDYHRLDISFNYKFSMKSLEGDIGFSLFNVYNRKNVKFRRFSQLDTDLSSNNDTIGNTNYVQNDLFLLGFTPNISMEIRF